MKRLFLLSTVLMAFGLINAQDEQSVKVKFGGYLRYELFYDTYQSVDTRDHEVYLYPMAESLDANGDDLNAVGSLNMLSLQSRVFAALSGPDAFGAKTSGKLEIDYLGIAGGFERTPRIRHAFIKLDWGKTQLLMGHYWHPMWNENVFPSTVTMGAGVPFHVLNRSNQARLTYALTDGFKVNAAALIHSYHKSIGPADQQRDAGLPDLQLRLDIGDPKSVYAGATFGYKWLRPVLYTVDTTNRESLGSKIDKEYKHSFNELLGSYNFNLFFKYSHRAFDLKLEMIQGENMTNYIMIGGYGMKTGSMNSDGSFEYANLVTRNFWFDFETKGKLRYGIFAGISENLGSNSDYTSFSKTDFTSTNSLLLSPNNETLVTERSRTIDFIYRVAPKIMYTSGKVMVAGEINYTAAAYGTAFDAKNKATDNNVTSSTRFICSVKYSF